jgi:hypothetical protein
MHEVVAVCESEVLAIEVQMGLHIPREGTCCF